MELLHLQLVLAAEPVHRLIMLPPLAFYQALQVPVPIIQPEVIRQLAVGDAPQILELDLRIVTVEGLHSLRVEILLHVGLQLGEPTLEATTGPDVARHQVSAMHEARFAAVALAIPDGLVGLVPPPGQHLRHEPPEPLARQVHGRGPGRGFITTGPTSLLAIT